MSSALASRRLLVVEDDFFLADDLATALKDEGAIIVGPASNLSRALVLLADAAELDGAVIDINLHGEMAYPIADALLDRAIPFLFTTGYDRSAIPARYAGVPRCEKPVDPRAVVRLLFG